MVELCCLFFVPRFQEDIVEGIGWNLGERGDFKHASWDQLGIVCGRGIEAKAMSMAKYLFSPLGELRKILPRLSFNFDDTPSNFQNYHFHIHGSSMLISWLHPYLQEKR